MSEILQRAVKNSAWLSASSIGTGLLGFVSATASIKHLGVTQAGFAVAILSLIGILSTLTGFGIGSALVFRVSQSHGNGVCVEAKKSIEAALLLALLVGAGGVCCTWAANDAILQFLDWDSLNADAKTFTILCGLVFAVGQLGTPYQAVVEGCHRYDRRAGIFLFAIALQALATVFLLPFRPTLTFLGAVNLTTTALRTIGLALAAKEAIGFIPKPKWSSGALHGVWRFSRWVYLGSVCALGFSGFDRMIIISYFGSALLPVYTVTRRFYEMTHEILTTQTAHFVPMITSIGAENRVASADIDDRLRWFVAVVAAWLYAGVLFFGPLLLELSVSSAFAESARFPLIIMAGVGFFHAQAIVPFYSSQAKGRPEYGFALNTVCAIGVPVAMVSLGKLMGFSGAVVGQLTIGVGSLLFAWLCTDCTCRGSSSRFFSPISRPLSLLLVVGVFYSLWLRAVLSPAVLALVGTVIMGLFLPLLFRMESPRTRRVETLHRAVMIFYARFGCSSTIIPSAINRIFAIENMTGDGKR